MDNRSFMEPIGNKSVVDMVVERITDAIIDGELKPGDKIPTEVELSENLAVGRNSIREAIKILTALGILEIRRADGTYVSNQFSERMLNPLVYSFILAEDSSTSLIELRRLLEVGVLEIVIGKATQEDIDKLEMIHSRLHAEAAKKSIDAKKFAEIDIEFHKEIISITHNPLINKIGDIITRLTRASQVKTVKTLIGTNDIQFIVDVHEETLALIKNKDYSNVKEVVEKSFLIWKLNID